jgi:hypothetical protein
MMAPNEFKLFVKAQATEDLQKFVIIDERVFLAEQSRQRLIDRIVKRYARISSNDRPLRYCLKEFKEWTVLRVANLFMGTSYPSGTKVIRANRESRTRFDEGIIFKRYGSHAIVRCFSRAVEDINVRQLTYETGPWYLEEDCETYPVISSRNPKQIERQLWLRKKQRS